MRNIVLIGLPGCGKTGIGRAAASRLGYKFYDMDEFIEQKAGMTVSEIFSLFGERRFREMESDVARELSLLPALSDASRLSGESGAIISTGGGVVLSEANMTALSKNSLIVYIERDPEAIAGSIDVSGRPLLKDDPGRLEILHAERAPLYRLYADEILKNDGNFTAAVDELLTLAERDDLSGGYAVIGDPIRHSLSPFIHNFVFKALGAKAKYGAVRVRKGKLPGFIDRVRAEGCGGFNVTMPHKTDILPFVGEISPEATICGSVNTVVMRDGRLFGHNTDMEGLATALSEEGFSFRGMRALILGAGGVANTVAVKAALDGADAITLLARTPEKAHDILARVKNAHSGITVLSGEMIPEALCKNAGNADVLINTTPLGMTGIRDDFASLKFLKYLPKHALVCDLIYSPPRTSLLREAASFGLKTQNGLLMLIYQALLADRLFLENTEINFNIKDMAKELLTVLGREPNDNNSKTDGKTG